MAKFQTSRLLAIGLGCFLAAAPPGTGQDAIDIKTIIDLNYQSVRSIHAIAAEIDLYDVAGGKRYAASKTTWYHQGHQERLRIKLYDRSKPGGPVSTRDGFNDAAQFRAIEGGYDFDSPPGLSESVDGPGYGRLGPRAASRTVLGVDSRTYLLLAISHEQESLTLKELAGKATSPRIARGPSTTSPEYQLELPVGKQVYRVNLDPRKAFAMTRFEVSAGDGATVTGWVEGVKWQHFGNGVHLPTELKTVDGSGPDAEQALITVRYLHVNDRIPESEIGLVFPDWMRVYEEPSGRVLIADGKGGFRHTFASRDEYKGWAAAHRPTPADQGQLPTSTRRWLWVSLGALALAAGVVAGVRLFRRRGGEHAADAP